MHLRRPGFLPSERVQICCETRPRSFGGWTAFPSPRRRFGSDICAGTKMARVGINAEHSRRWSLEREAMPSWRRTFGQMVEHLSATNYILAAAPLGEEPPADAGDELGPEAVRTKAEIFNYLKGSFAYLAKAIEAIGQKTAPVKSSPISPLKSAGATRLRPKTTPSTKSSSPGRGSISNHFWLVLGRHFCRRPVDVLTFSVSVVTR